MDNVKELLEDSVKLAEGADLSGLSALNLAYVGDAVFELFVRTMLAANGRARQNDNHQKAKGYVRAKAQSDMYYKLAEILNEEEMAAMKRGRNAKSYTKAKNADVSDYRHATGVEALFGYLYLKGDIKRLMEIFEICVKADEKQ